MKSLIFVISATVLLLSACSESKSREEQIKEVCDCFKENKDRKECIKLQSEYALTYEATEFREFMQETSQCSHP